MPCQCESCLTLLATSRDKSHTLNVFLDMLSDGRVVHIGTDDSGQPIYQDTT